MNDYLKHCIVCSELMISSEYDKNLLKCPKWITEYGHDFQYYQLDNDSIYSIDFSFYHVAPNGLFESDFTLNYAIYYNLDKPLHYAMPAETAEACGLNHCEEEPYPEKFIERLKLVLENMMLL